MRRYVIRDPEAPARWAYLGRICRLWNERDRPGQADGCKEARKIIHKLTLTCKRCGALVSWRAAKAAAKKGRRPTLRVGDGCAGPQCSKHHRPSRFKAGQKRMVGAVRSGRRVVSAWPDGVADCDVWLLPEREKKAAVVRAEELAGVGSELKVLG